MNLGKIIQTIWTLLKEEYFCGALLKEIQISKFVVNCDFQAS
jgi:hypothetical protein